MKELAAAITTFFNVTNDLKTALDGQLYPLEAAQDAVFPYGIYYFMPEDTDYNFTDESESVDVQFSVFSDSHSPTEIFTLEGYLKALFDNAALSVSGYRLIQFKRTGSRITKDSEMDTWSFIAEYNAIIEKTRS